MDYKIHFRKLKGKWFLSVGTKGYGTTTSLNKVLSELFSEKTSASAIFTSTKDANSNFKLTLEKEKDGYYTTNLYDVNTGELVNSCKHCPHLIDDFNIESEFYANYDLD